MKTLIACYSFTGNTLKVAESLKAATSADLTRIEAQKDASYLMKCVNAMLKRRAPIKLCKTDLAGFAKKKMVFVGSALLKEAEVQKGDFADKVRALAARLQ